MANRDYTQVREILRSKGYSWTEPRRIVFRALSNAEPLSIAEIVKKVAKDIDRVSVYRTIELFEKLAIVHRLSIGWKYKIELSERFIAHHHHLICLKCGRVIDISDDRHINSFIREVADNFNFEPSSHQFEIEGLCADCRAKQPRVLA